MLEITLIEVKAYLWITTTSDDTKLQYMLDWVNELVESNVWDISEWEKTMTVKNSSVKNNTFTLNIINPTDLTEINWNDVSWLVVWTDYLIKDDWEVIIKDLWNYTANDFWFFTVKFNAWYATAPKSLIKTVSEYVWYLYSQDNWKDITSEQLWPRAVAYWQDNSNWISLAQKKFKDWLRKFIPLAIRVY